MNKEEILAKSRAENKNQDIYEQEIIKQASKIAVLVQIILATVFFVAQIFAGKGINWGLWALVFSSSMVMNWMTYRKLHRRQELMIAVADTVLVSVMSGYYIYSLMVSSTAL